jgi:hypothetical protein
MYTGPYGEQVPLGRDDVGFIRCPNPLDFYRGLGPVQALLVDLDAARYSAEWNRNFFINEATPGGVIQMEQSLSDPEWERFTTRWRESHQGVSNAHRVAVLEGGAKWVDASYSMRDMQFAELAQVSTDKLQRAYGIPKFLLGEVGDVNRATAEASAVMYAQWLLVPRLERWKGFLNNDFLPRFGPSGKGVEFDYCSPIPPDDAAELAAMAAKAAAAKIYVEMGVTFESVQEGLDLPDALVWEKPEPPPAPIMAPPPPGQDGNAPPPPNAPPAKGQPPGTGEGSDAQQADATNWRRVSMALLDTMRMRDEARARDDAASGGVQFQYDD